MNLPRHLFTDDIVQAVERWDGDYLAPTSENRKVDGLQVFKARWIEIFGISHFLLPGLWFLPLIALCFYQSAHDPDFSLVVGAATTVVGILAWTLLEYGLHRFYFHLQPTEKFESKFQLFMVHGYHHQFPNDPLRLVAPPLLSFPIAVPVAALYYFTLGPGYLWLMAFAGTALGYLGYDWIHFYTHHARPTSRVGKFLRRYHMVHHYKDSEGNFGISSPLWDYVFGTVSPKVAMKESSTA